MTTDRLTLAGVFEDAGFDHAKAARVATAIFEAITDNVASKSDLAATEGGLRADLTATRNELKTEITDLRHGMELRFERLERSMDVRFEGMERRIDQVVIRLGALIVASLGVSFAALHFIH